MNFGDCWLSIMGKVKGPHILDGTRQAQLQINSTIDELQQRENEIKTDMANIAVQVKSAQMSKSKARVQQLLISSAAKRKALNLTSRKRMALEHQQEAIASTQLNQQVLSSMKQTSTVLKEMGLNDAIQTSDEVMMDLQEAQQDVIDLQETLSSSLNPVSDSLSEDALAEELALLLGDEPNDATMISTPVLVNTTKKLEQPEQQTFVTVSDKTGQLETTTMVAPEPYVAQIAEAEAKC